jgi:transposase
MLTNDVEYADLGGDYFARLIPERAMQRIVCQPTHSGSPSASTRSRPPDHA